MNTDDNLTSQNNFWLKLCQYKFDCYYYSFHFNRCVLLCKILKCITTLGTILFTALFMNWYSIEWIKILCLIMIIVLQMVNGFSEVFPFDKRKTELFYIEKDLTNMYNEMESDWIKIKKGKYSEAIIDDKVKNYQERHSFIMSGYFKDDYLPQINKIKEKATSESDKYLSNL